MQILCTEFTFKVPRQINRQVAVNPLYHSLFENYIIPPQSLTGAFFTRSIGIVAGKSGHTCEALLVLLSDPPVTQKN